MADPMFQLIYGSESWLHGSEAEIDADLDHLLATSRRNNDAAGITGALLFTGSCFTQVLEGPPHEVERTFERISRDMRHGGVVLIDLQRKQHRNFPSWSMTLLDARTSAAAELAVRTSLAGKTSDELSGQPIVELIQRFLARRAAQPQAAAEFPAQPSP